MRHRSAQMNRFAPTLLDVTDFPQLMWEARPFHATQPGVSPTNLHSAPSPPPKPRQALSSHIDVHAQRETTIQRGASKFGLVDPGYSSDVQAPDPPAPGWPELYRTVREADVSKVEDCREDIDTLLVFAGLYSAVLTAFVIESYTHLQQDPQDVIIGLLQQIATQNFISGPGFLNSTTTATAPPPFEPPLWAIRVNVLWFTSLLLSLTSASFGILVKQWLREYLAIEYTVPQQRLRARQYRNPGLAQWRVFEIAAFLPLLLQLSLGLFFLGLCFFTAAVHNSVGRTTTPLAAAWAFLLLMTTIAPLFSPRCPFKTTFLKRSLKHTRRYVSLVVRCFTPPMRSVARHIGTAVSACLGAVRPGNGWYFRRLSRAADWIETVRSPWARYPATGALIVIAVPYFVKTKKTKIFVQQTAKVPTATEEEEFVKKERNDVEILLSVDAVMPDDGLLPTMLDVVRQQAGDKPGKVVQFITHLIAQRNDRPLDGARIASLAGTTRLSAFAWAAISDAIADVLGPKPLELDTASSTRDWIHNVIVILNSHPGHHLSDRAIRGLGQVLLVPMRMPGHECSGGVPLSRCLPELGVAWVNAEPMCLRCISDVYRTLLCTDQELTSNDVSLRHLLDAHAPDDAFVESSSGLLHGLFAAMTRFMAKAAADFPTEMRGFDEAVHIVLQYGERFGGQGSVGGLCCRMLLTEPGARAILVHLAALHPQCRVKTDRTEIPLEGNTWDDNPRIQAHLNAACEWLCENDDAGGVPLDYVRLCAISYMWVDSALLARAVEKYHRAQGWKTELAQRDYWFDSATPSSPEERFRDDQVMACDVIQNHHGFISLDLVDALWPFVPEERREQLLRLICKKRAYVPRAIGAGDGGDGKRGMGGGCDVPGAVVEETYEAFKEKTGETGEVGGKKNSAGESGASEVPGILETRGASV